MSLTVCCHSCRAMCCRCHGAPSFHAALRHVATGSEEALPLPLLSFTVAGLLEQSIRLHKLVGDMSWDLSGAYLFDELPDLIVALLRADTPKQRTHIRRGKKRLADKKPRSTP